MAIKHFHAEKTQSEAQCEDNPGVCPSEVENCDDWHPHQPLTISQQCEENPFAFNTEVYYENRYFPRRRCTPFNIPDIIQNNHMESTMLENSTVVPFQTGVAAVNIPPHLGFIAIGPSPDCVQAALPHTEGSSSQHSPQHQLL